MAITASVVRGFTFATGVDVTAAALNELGEPGVTVATPIAVGNGGTNATTASAARTNLGLGTIATQASNAVALTGGTISGTIMTLPSYAVSGVPSASPAGQVIYVTDGNSGAATVACSDGSNWKVVALGATIST
mgnify:FL=1|jgi:hypothetical protein|tara:strand:- start:811 stop:1212 length:402 start_codon:yes stop_codon:yes gene_type:complete